MSKTKNVKRKQTRRKYTKKGGVNPLRNTIGMSLNDFPSVRPNLMPRSHTVEEAAAILSQVPSAPDADYTQLSRRCDSLTLRLKQTKILELEKINKIKELNEQLEQIGKLINDYTRTTDAACYALKQKREYFLRMGKSDLVVATEMPSVPTHKIKKNN